MMKGWKASIKKDFTCKNPVLIEGLPGIGNVGKIVVDYLIDSFNAEKIGSFFSYDLPNSVFVTEDGCIQLPSIDLYYLKKNKKDFLFLAGDAQPSEQRSSYELSEHLLDLSRSFDCEKIITLGGIGLNQLPESSSVYITGNNPSLIQNFKKHGVNTNSYGVVGPIIGVSGLLLGLSKNHNIPAVALLGETFAHPMHIGVKESRRLLEVLDKEFDLGVDYSDLDEEIALIQKELDQDDLSNKQLAKKKGSRILKYKDLNYIG